MEIPPKLAPGKSGKPVKLISNYFSIDAPKGEIYHYYIEIHPLSRRAFHTVKYDYPKVISTVLNTDKNFKNCPSVYGGNKNIYTRIKLDKERDLKCHVILEDTEFEVFVYGSGSSIKLDPIHALFSDEVSSVPQKALRALEAILRFGPSLKYFPIKSSFFYSPPQTDNCPLGAGIKVWTGYRQSLLLGQSQLLLNLDIKGKAFYPKRPLLNFSAEYLGISPLSNITRDDMRRISRELKVKRVETSLKGKRRVFVVKELTSGNATYCKIGGQDNITLADYFAKNYEPLKYPHLPCIELKRGVIYPLEVCEIVNEPVVCLADKQSSEIIKFTARSPKQRFDKIVESLKMSNEFKDTYLKGFGIIIGNEPLKLEGRIIAAPKVSYDKQKIIKPKDGCWNMKNKQYFRASSVYSWIVISFSNCTSLHLERFTKLLSDIAAEHGMEMRPVKNICIVGEPRPVVKVILNEMFQKFETDLMVVVLPEKDKTMYADVKEFSDSKSGLVTQCVKDVSVSKKCKPSVLSNLCQKINAKMGGINSSIKINEIPFLLQRPVITIGANVLHEYPEIVMEHHLATVVGSLDAHLSKYAVKHSLQRCGTVKYKGQRRYTHNQYILDLKFMITDLLKAFYFNNRGNKPEKIIFFRAGVCDGQFIPVKSREVRCIREACQTLDAAYSPGITYIVLQKRHHTRFAPQDFRHGVGRMGNIPPGTIVDSDVVRPSGFDFFLCSHFVTQGTSVPRHYTILEDDNHFSADELEKFTYYLCHTYAYCTKSLSCPAPVRYAEQSAQKIRHYLSAKLEKLDIHYREYDKIQPIVENLKSTMFFI